MRREFHCPSAVGRSDWLRDASGLPEFVKDCQKRAMRILRGAHWSPCYGPCMKLAIMKVLDLK